MTKSAASFEKDEIVYAFGYDTNVTYGEVFISYNTDEEYASATDPSAWDGHICVEYTVPEEILEELFPEDDEGELEDVTDQNRNELIGIFKDVLRDFMVTAEYAAIPKADTFMVVCCDHDMGVVFEADNDDSTETEKIIEKGVITFGGIEWRILAREDDRMLVISDKTLERRKYHGNSTDFRKRGDPIIDENVSWGQCTLREYLNGEFFENTFSNEEKSRIIETTNINSGYPLVTERILKYKRKTDGSENDTVDKVFLLSAEEVVKYFGDSGKWQKTLKAKSTGKLYESIDDKFNEERIAVNSEGTQSGWWLRTPAKEESHFMTVIWRGLISFDGKPNRATEDVRPAMWIKMK